MVDTTVVKFAELVALTDDISPKSCILEQELTTLGRQEGTCDVVIRRRVVSRIHAQIERVGSHYRIQNLSRNKTYINGEPILQQTVLKDQDKIGFAIPEPLLLFEDPDATVNIEERLRYDETTLTFYLYNHELDLTPNQFRLLQHLYRHIGQVCTRERCAEAIWGETYAGMDADNLNRVVSGLRRRFRRHVPDVELIHVKRGVGYMLKV